LNQHHEQGRVALTLAVLKTDPTMSLGVIWIVYRGE
jgi:hypothetical protein